MNNTKDQLEFRDRVVKMSLGEFKLSQLIFVKKLGTRERDAFWHQQRYFSGCDDGVCNNFCCIPSLYGAYCIAFLCVK